MTPGGCSTFWPMLAGIINGIKIIVVQVQKKCKARNLAADEDPMLELREVVTLRLFDKLRVIPGGKKIGDPFGSPKQRL
jgi:hypothetical protein